MDTIDLFAVDLDQPIETLARWYNEFNCWKWPSDLLDLKPEWYEIEGNGYPPQIYRCAAYIRPLMRAIDDKIGHKECLRWHHLHNLGRTDQEFEQWWQGY
jgi:hypothetical protein